MWMFLRVAAYTWLGILFVVVFIGAVSIIIFEGYGQFLAIFSPFNFWNWGLIGLLALPGVGLLRLSERLKIRRGIIQGKIRSVV